MDPVRAIVGLRTTPFQHRFRVDDLSQSFPTGMGLVGFVCSVLILLAPKV